MQSLSNKSVFIYTFFPKNNAPLHVAYSKVEAAIHAGIQNIQSNITYEKRCCLPGSVELQALQEIENFAKKIAREPSIENLQRLIDMFESDRPSKLERSVCHQIVELPVIQEYF